MGRTACTEPQCLYKGDLYLYLLLYLPELQKTNAGSAHRTYVNTFKGAKTF